MRFLNGVLKYLIKFGLIYCGLKYRLCENMNLIDPDGLVPFGFKQLYKMDYISQANFRGSEVLKTGISVGN